MILSHLIQLKPTIEQATYFQKAAGISRFTWNWALAQIKAENNEKINVLELKKQFNAVKHQEFSWISEIAKDCNQQPFANLQKTLTRFFKDKKSNKVDSIGFPKFKKRGKRDSFYISNDQFQVVANKIKVPKLGWVKMAESLRFKGKIMSATISKRASKWFVSIAVEMENYSKPKISDNSIGIDLGITSFATLSTGEKIIAPKPLKTNLKKLKRANQSVSRKKIGSKNRRKAREIVQKIYYRISNIRKDFLQKLTTRLCSENQAICVENLNVQGMMKNRKLSRAISDLGWGEFNRQLEYKSAIYGNELTEVSRWFPSSKLCSDCGFKAPEMPLNIREWECNNCKSVHDRDINAAKNLDNQNNLVQNTLGLREIYACGEMVRDSGAAQELANAHF